MQVLPYRGLQVFERGVQGLWDIASAERTEAAVFIGKSPGELVGQ
jgi:hypothetical protein